jgi:5-methylcytosine-specific restriction endonuclease McrA
MNKQAYEEFLASKRARMGVLRSDYQPQKLISFPAWLVGDAPGYKRCSVTDQIHLLSDFHRDKSQRDGRRPDCSECCAARSAKRYAENSDTLRQRARERGATPEYKAKRAARIDLNRAEHNARSRAYAKANPEKIKLASKNWRARNVESNRARKIEWARANPLAVKEQRFRRRALLKNARLCRLTSQQIAARVSVFGDVCAYCSATWSHLDHVIPLTRGGAHCLANLRPACARCNLTKSNKPHRQWFREIGRIK